MYIESIFSREYSLRRESILRNLKLYSSSPFSPYKFPCLVESDDRTTILCNLVYGISNKFVRHTRLLGRGAENVVVARSHPRRATFYSKPHDARRMEITWFLRRSVGRPIGHAFVVNGACEMDTETEIRGVHAFSHIHIRENEAA